MIETSAYPQLFAILLAYTHMMRIFWKLIFNGHTGRAQADMLELKIAAYVVKLRSSCKASM